MRKPRFFTIGRLLVLLFSVMTAAKEVMAGSLVRNFDPLQLVCVTFLVTTAFFALGILMYRSDGPRLGIFDRFGDVIALNIATLTGWGTVFYALQFIEPAIVSTLAVATLPLFSILVQMILKDTDPKGPVDVAGSIAICLVIGWVSWIAYDSSGKLTDAPPIFIQISISACILSGLGMAISNVLARRLYAAGWKPRDVMARRFVLLAVAAGLLWVQSGRGADGFELGNVVTFSAFGLIAIAIPIFVLQKGLETSTAVETGALISLSPILVLAFQLFDPQIGFDIHTSLAVIFSVIVVALFLILRDYAAAQETKAQERSPK